eukprot:g21516.t1
MSLGATLISRRLRWQEPSRPEPFPSPARSPQRLAVAEEELQELLSQVQSLTSRVLALEEQKQRSARRMTERFQQLARTCEGQGELIAAQQRRLETQETRAVEDWEGATLEGFEVPSLHEFRVQEQELEKHMNFLSEILHPNSSASSGSGARQKVFEDPEERAEKAATRWPDGEAPRAVPMADGAQALPRAKAEAVVAKPSSKGNHLWDSVLELCAERRFLEAYKQVIAEPEETCLLRLMKHTGPIVERLDAESNSRLIRRLIHILSSPSKEPAAASIEQIFSWLWQALNQGIHFTASQVEDLVAALQKVSESPQSPLTAAEKAEASQLLQQVSTHRRA